MKQFGTLPVDYHDVSSHIHYRDVLPHDTSVLQPDEIDEEKGLDSVIGFTKTIRDLYPALQDVKSVLQYAEDLKKQRLKENEFEKL